MNRLLFSKFGKAKSFIGKNGNFKNNFNKFNGLDNLPKINHSTTTITTITTFNNNSVLFKMNNQQTFKFSTDSKSTSSLGSASKSASTSELGSGSTSGSTSESTSEASNEQTTNDVFNSPKFSHLNKRDPNEKYYDYNFPKKYEKNIEKEILNKIENNSRDKFNFFNLFVYMKEIANLEQITLLNGEVVTLRECLVREITYNPTFVQSYLALFPLMDHLINDSVCVKIYYRIDEENRFILLEPNEPIENCEVSEFNLKKIDLLKRALTFDSSNRHALDLMTFIIIESDQLFIINSFLYTPRNISEFNYYANRDFNPYSVYYFSRYINPWWGTFMTKPENGEKFSKVSLLIEGITKFPDFPSFYGTLASIMTNNNQFVKIKKQSTTTTNNNNNNNDEFIEMNRIDLLSKGIEIIRTNEKYKDVDIGQFYYELAHYLGLNETVKFVDYDGIEKELNKKQLLIKAIGVSPGIYILSQSINQLLVLMSPYETVMINGKPHSRIDVSNIQQTGLSYELLSKIYKRENNIEQYNYYNQFNLLLNESFNKCMIHSIEAAANDEPKIAEFYYELSKYYESNDSGVQLEPIVINGKPHGKIDLLIASIHYEKDKFETINRLSELAKELPTINSKITLLDGTTKSKLDILSETSKYNIQSLFEFETQVIDQLLVECEAKSLTQRESYGRVISADPLFSLAYLKLGIEMQKYSIDDYLIDTLIYEKEGMPFIYGKGEIKFTRKQLFLKFLELSKTDFKLKENDILLGWYHLALEMDSNEIQFGKTKKEILLSIIEKDETFSRVFSELSTMETQYDKIIELMVKAINVESDVNIKSNHYYKLSQYLKDNNEKVKLGDGSIMNKQQLLVESIELTPLSNNHSLAYYSLANLLTNSTDTIELFGESYTQSKLFELALENKNTLSLVQVFEIRFKLLKKSF
ncbi:hypothetical protein ACTFIW_000365 [Dictyostelium discoideum]